MACGRAGAQVAIGDIVDVKRGSMSDKSGTVKFIKANNLFLHSRCAVVPLPPGPGRPAKAILHALLGYTKMRRLLTGERQGRLKLVREATLLCASWECRHRRGRFPRCKCSERRVDTAKGPLLSLCLSQGIKVEAPEHTCAQVPLFAQVFRKVQVSCGWPPEMGA